MKNRKTFGAFPEIESMFILRSGTPHLVGQAKAQKVILQLEDEHETQKLSFVCLVAFIPLGRKPIRHLREMTKLA